MCESQIMHSFKKQLKDALKLTSSQIYKTQLKKDLAKLRTQAAKLAVINQWKLQIEAFEWLMTADELEHEKLILLDL